METDLGLADVGGGSVSNNVSNSLANPSLAWMVNECFLANTGIIFRCDAFQDTPGVAAVVAPRLSSRQLERVVLEDGGLDPEITVNNEGKAFTDVLTSSTLSASGVPSSGLGSAYASERSRMEVPCASDTNLVGVRQENMVRDAIAPMYDQLKAQPMWWLLEIVPIWEYKQD